MDKIAAYAIALRNDELEKRAEFIIENFGTCGGQMPAAYLQAFDRMMEKGASLQAAGQAVTGGLYRVGKALGGPGTSGSRTGLGGKLMDFASGVGGKAERIAAQKFVGGTALGLGALGTAGAGYALK